MNATSLDTFVQLSSALTGVDSQQLKPAIDPILLADEYLAFLQKNVDAAALTRLFDTFTQLISSGNSPKEAAGTILADTNQGWLARSLIKLWLLGTWYDPNNPGNALQVISPEAYTESLVWQMMQAHPMGFSKLSFGYWAQPPPSLKQFITFAPDNTGGTTHA